MKKIIVGLLFGIAAGIIDLVPMVIQKLPWNANLSAFSLWVIAGFLISTSTIKISSPFKGILLSFIVLIPSALLIAWQEPKNLIPIFIMTCILGGILGFLIDKFIK